MWEELGPIGEAAAALAQARVWSLTDEQLCSHLDRVYAAEQALAAARSHLVAEIAGRGVPARQGVASVVSWLVGRLHIAGSTAGRWVEVARPGECGSGPGDRCGGGRTARHGRWAGGG